MPSTVTGEFLGTLILLLLGNGVVANVLLTDTKGHSGGLIVITAGWAFAVMSGGMVAVALGAPGELNPAVSIANVVTGVYPLATGLAHVAAQMLGAMCGATLVWLHYLPHWARTKDQGLILASFCNAPAVRTTGPNLFAEIIGTAVLVLVAGAIGARGVLGATPATNIGSFLVGCLVWGIGLSLGGPTGYAINPARDLGPRIMHALLPIAGKGGSDWGYAWIPVVGPVVGASVAALAWARLT
ncbi:MIP/aquaporin family protein [Gemmatimonas phototrophica]|uniref:Glycerol transporter n=1 Tax=Gemmatimonas phototrophica TaxID=1379270 RepID=A0A143BL92_9BACT|nr:MIP/aquaporin family protein [Gemmatimonas phototrophica]AMW05809.1 glycerol transporter [Gemmatimonas phototrophica]